MEIGLSLSLVRGGRMKTARELADAVISALSPAAWYHMRGAGVPTSSGGFASMWPDMADTDNALVLPGVSGNSASTPSISLAGDLDLIVRANLNDYTTATENTFICKRTATSNWQFRTDTGSSGKIQLVWWSGTVARVALSTVACGITDGATAWLRATLNPTTGDVNFYKASDATSVPSSWTQIGTTVSTTPGALDNGSVTIYVGAGPSGTSELANGKIYRAIIKDGIDGTTVFDADFSAQAKGTTSFTESSSNAATVTVNQSGALPAHIGNKKDLLQGTATNQPAYSAGVLTGDGVDNKMQSNIWPTQAQPHTVYWVGKQIGWTSGDFFYDGAGPGGNATIALYQDVATPTVRIYAGGSGPQIATLDINTRGIVCCTFNGFSSSIRLNNDAAVVGFANTNSLNGFTLFASGTGTAVCANATAEEVIIFFAAHDEATQDAVISALNTLNTVF